MGQAFAGAFKRQTRARIIGLALMSSTAIYAVDGLYQPAGAQQASSITYAIPAGSLSAAMSRFGVVSNLQILYPAALVSGKTSAGASGSFTYEEAMNHLLAGTGLAWHFTNANTITIVDPSLASGAGAVSADGSTLLDTIVIQGDASLLDNDTVAAKYSSSATKIDTPLIDTARSVSVVTRKEMEQRSVEDIIEAVNYSAGVVTGVSGFDPRFDQINIRGYDATTMGDYKDGLRQPYMNYGTFRTNPYSLERVEIVKGPVSVLYGAGTPAGIVNKVSKFANGGRIREVKALYGTEDVKQFAFDIGDALGETGDFSYRIVGLAQEGDTNFDIADNQYFLQPSLQWNPSDQTELTVYGLLQNTETDAAVGAITTESGELLPLRASDPDYDYQKINQQQAGYEFEHEFNDVVTFRQNLRYSHLDLRSRYLEVYSWDGTVAHRYPWAIRDEMNVFQVDSLLEWNFDTGPLAHTLLTGLDYTKVNSSFAYGYGDVDPAFDFDIANPAYGVSGPTADYDFTQSNADLSQVGLYAIDEIEVDNWFFTLGGRQTWVDQSRIGSYPSLGIPINDELTQNAFTGQASALYAFDNGVSPYISYATSFEPTTNRSVTGGILDPLEGEQVELGLKYEPLGYDILLSAAAYHLVEKNKPVIVDANAGTYRSLGEVTNKGIELEARGNIADGWDFIAAYTYIHARITAGDDVGNSPALVPEHAASLWLNYTFYEDSALQGLSAGAGVRYIGETYASTSDKTKNDATFYVDAAISYDFGAVNEKYDGLVASFRVNNIANKRNTVCEEGYCYLGEGRNIMASLKYNW